MITVGPNVPWPGGPSSRENHPGKGTRVGFTGPEGMGAGRSGKRNRKACYDEGEEERHGKREYRTKAARQAAYRDRHRDQEPPLQSYLAALARTLHRVLADAVRDGESRLPVELLGRRADETLRRMI